MSERVEWFDTDYTSMTVVPAGTPVPFDDEESEFETGTTALVLHGSITVVIDGEPRVLAEMLREAADQLHID